jgi:hypothetical protein
MKRIRLFLASLLLGISMTVGFAAPSLVAATPKSDVCTALGSGAGCGSQPHNGVDINNVITIAVNIMSSLVGVVAVIMIIVAGFKYVTSGGDSNSVASAKNTLVYAIVGLVVVAFAQIIVRFVLQKATGTPNRRGMITTAHHYASTNLHYTLNYDAA